MGTLREGVVRAVLHYLISDDDVEQGANAVRSVLQVEPRWRPATRTSSDL